MTARPVITARHVSKSYLTHRSKATQLKERVVRGRGMGTETFHALTDVSMVVGEGETVGLIGPNGAGKSTLLKMLAGILRPTAGEVEVQGRIASLLELGAGFNGELTGRENVYLNAALLGLPRREVDSLFSSIVAFSEQEQRIDDPVKHYSSGEYVKLAFSIAVHVDPDVLLVDEVLAVGDEAFARKCLAKITEFQQAGKTILFVTHALDLVERLCTRGVVVDQGRVQYDGDPAFAVGTLRRILGTDRPEGEPPAPVPRGAYVHDATPSLTIGGPRADTFVAGEPLHLRVEVEVIDADDVFAGDVVVVAVGSGDYPIFAVRTPPGGGLPAVPGRYEVDFTIEKAPALNGSFILAVQVEDSDTGYPLAVARFDTVLRCRSSELPGILTVASTSVVKPAPAISPHP